MSSKDSVINLSSSSLGNAQEALNVHLMPCKIHHNGEAKIDEYFQHGIKEREGKYKAKASFQGRILEGETISMPSGYCGYVIREEHKPFTEDEDRTFKASGKFSKFTYWNLEDKPSDNDKIKKALQWVDVSAAIHAPMVKIEDNYENNTPDTIR